MSESGGEPYESQAETFTRASKLLSRLISRDDLQAGAAAMPSRELFYAAGLAFLFTRRVAAGVSGVSGPGFVLANISPGCGKVMGGSPTAGLLSAMWSAPVFVKVLAGGIGFSVGMTTVDSCIVIDTPEEVKRFTTARSTFGGSMTGAVGRAAGAHLAFGQGENKRVFSYSTVDGYIANFMTFEGLRVAVDTKKMDTVYGQGWDLDEVLSGRVPYPSDMDTLLQELKSARQLYAVELKDVVRKRLEGDVDAEGEA